MVYKNVLYIIAYKNVLYTTINIIYAFIINDNCFESLDWSRLSKQSESLNQSKIGNNPNSNILNDHDK